MIDYIIIGLLVITIFILLIILLKTKKDINNDIEIRITKMQTELVKEIRDFKYDFAKVLTNDFQELNDRIENRLNRINDKVNERLDENFEKTNRTFDEVLKSLVRINEAQKKLDILSSDIVSLESVLTDKKTRGIFGEVNLYQILSSVFGEKNDKIYNKQYTLSNNAIVDAICFAPFPIGSICIDSKFPLENYRNMLERGITVEEKNRRERIFELDVKKHINAIADKYIIPGETSEYAIMFLPAEAIFAEINAYHTSLIEYAYSRKVYIASPTTLMNILTMVQSVLMGIERDKYAGIIHSELNKLGEEFGRYKERWEKLSSHIDTVNKDVKELHITTDKISRRFDSISNVDIKKELENRE